MRQCRSYGSVRGAVSDDRPYRDLAVMTSGQGARPTWCRMDSKARINRLT